MTAWTTLTIFVFHQLIETLEKLSIPSYDPNAVKSSSVPASINTHEGNYARPSSSCDVVDAVMNSPPIQPLSHDYDNETMRNIGVPVYSVEVSGDDIASLPYRTLEHPTSTVLGPESNSEDSSLSDGDRTLVGDASPILSTANSPSCSDQHLSSPEDHSRMNGDAYGRTTKFIDKYERNYIWNSCISNHYMTNIDLFYFRNSITVSVLIRKMPMMRTTITSRPPTTKTR